MNAIVPGTAKRFPDQPTTRAKPPAVTESQRNRLLLALKARLADEKHIRRLTTRHAAEVHLAVARDCHFRIDDRTLPLAANEPVKVSVERAAVEFLVPGK